MHCHLIHTILGFIWLVKVHILGFFFTTCRRNHTLLFTLPWNDVVDMFFLSLIQCRSADVQNGHHKKKLFLLQYAVNESHF